MKNNRNWITIALLVCSVVLIVAGISREIITSFFTTPDPFGFRMPIP